MLTQEENKGRLALFAGIDDVRFKRIVEPGDELVFECKIESVRGPIGKGKATAHVGDELAARGCLCSRWRDDRHRQRRRDLDHGPGRPRAGSRGHQRRALDDDGHLRRVDHRAHGDPERRIAAPEEALSYSASRPRGRRSPTQGSTSPRIDLIIVATVTPDMAFPSTGAILADQLGATNAAAYDLSAGCTGFMYAVAQGYGMLAGGLAQKALIVGGDVLSKILDWSDRGTAVLFGDGAGAIVLERVAEGGFLGFELGADGSGGPQLYLPAGGSRSPASAESVAEHQHFVKMNGREVFKFATRILVVCRVRAGRVWAHHRGRGCLRAAPGEREDHRACSATS